MKSTLIMTVFFVVITCVTPYKILFFLGFVSKSHRNAFDPVAAELAKRGNEVTILSSLSSSKTIEGITEIPLVENGLLFQNANISFFQADSDGGFRSMIDRLIKVCHLTYQDPEVTKMLKNPEDHRFDVVVVSAILNDFTLALGHHLGSPNVVFAPAQRSGSTAWSMNIPHPISYIPSGLDESTDRMTFWQRTVNTVIHLGFYFVKHLIMFPNMDDVIAQYIPGSPTISQLQNQISLSISNTHPATNHPIPSMPYSVEIGCVHCQTAKPLPNDLEDFMQASGDAGVIYFSLGSVTKGDSMPLEMRDKVIEAFARLPQKILWKYEANIPDLPQNIRLIKWAPQQDLLEHDKLRLFITHGGGLSTQEAVYHRCPILGFPLSADQWGNMATASKRGFAEYLDWRQFSVEDLLQKIHLLLTEDRYQKSADHYSAILRDQAEHPAERAAYWIEYVARHKGASHLKSQAEDLNFFQYFLLDVFATILLTVLSVLTVFYFALRYLYRIVFIKNKSRSNKDKTV